jgi:lipopolysaccharide transport system ATP-binding protein
MYVRLAFAVAAHLESEILIIDEVLAVGDAEFQKKCLGKMGDISKGEGRTVLFVSHNMGAIKSLCKQCILLDKGSIDVFDQTDQVINKYASRKPDINNIHKRAGNGRVTLQLFNICQPDTETALNEFLIGDEADLILVINFTEDITDIEIGINIKNTHDELISHVTNLDSQKKISGKKGETKKITIKLKSLNFTPGQYQMDIFVMEHNVMLDSVIEGLFFVINNSLLTSRPGGFPAHVRVFTPTSWEL